MKCYTASPWGSQHAYIHAVVRDSSGSGQTLYAIADTPEGCQYMKEMDLMPQTWTKRVLWTLGETVLPEYSNEPGILVLINYADRLHSDHWFGCIHAEFAIHYFDVLLKDKKTKAGSMWWILPDGFIQARNWTMTCTEDDKLVIYPLLGGQRE